MKKIILVIATLLVAVTSYAQVVDTDKLQAFIDDAKGLSREHVECQSESFDHYATEESKVTTAQLVFPDNLVTFGMRGETIPLIAFSTSDTTFRFVHLLSDDEIGYALVNGLIDKYYDEESEDIFGIPLIACNREDGEEQLLFLDENNTMLIRDDGDEVEVLYGSFNLMNTLRNTLGSVVEIVDEEYVDVEMFGGMDFGVHVNDVNKFCYSQGRITADPDGLIGFAQNIYTDNVAYLESQMAKAQSEEERDKLAAMAAEFKAEQEANIDNLRTKLNELERPGFIELRPGMGEYFVAIPKVTEELKAMVKPYAASGVYDWINNTGFGQGYGAGHTDQISCIITPRDVAREYVIRNFPRNKWYDEGFTAEYKDMAALEYQGRTPAVLYRFSQNEQGYNDMLRDLGHLFDRELGEKHWGLEVTQQSQNNGKRFVQLWGEGDILMCVIDVPQEKYCLMSIIVGVNGFEQAVNEYLFGGEKDFAKKCNIIIDNDLSDNSYGIHFTQDEYFYAGRSHKNGVHIDFGFARRFTE